MFNKKNKDPKLLIIDLPLLPVCIHVWYHTNHDVLVSKMSKYYEIKECVMYNDISKNPNVMQVNNSVICVLYDKDMSVVVHECVHIAWYVCDILKIKLDADNHEVQAYIAEHVYNSIDKFFSQKQK